MEIQARAYPDGVVTRRPRIVTHRLTKTKVYCPTGSRYATRANMRKVLTGASQYATIRNDGSQRWTRGAREIKARVTSVKLRIGCHVWSGQNFTTLKAWALQ